MKPGIRRKLANGKRRIQRPLDKKDPCGCSRPTMTASDMHHEIGKRTRGIASGGLGLMHALARRLGLIDALDRRLELPKFHLPYRESDHVLAPAYLPLCGGTCLQDLELLRHDEVLLDALGARRIPDPTTAGDFCRRFSPDGIRTPLDIIHDTRPRVWGRRAEAFFERAIPDMDGFLVETTGQCKRGMDIAYDGAWGYHALAPTPADTGEVLSIVNRPGNRPSHEGAAASVDRALPACFRGGFRRVLPRGDSRSSQSERLDRWDDDARARFIFGFEALANPKARAQDLPACAWRPLQRPVRHEVKTTPRQRPDKVEEAVVAAREFEDRRPRSEEVAEFDYRPTACRKTYRMVVVKKNISVEKGEKRLFDRIVYFFYITNDWVGEAAGIVFSANDRRDRENVLARLGGGVRALRAPVDNLESDWAYMVMTALAWNPKAWWALTPPERPGRYRERHRAEKRRAPRLEFKTFANAFVRLPCQIVRGGRQLIYRLPGRNPQRPIFFRLVDVLRCRRRHP